MKMVKVIFLVIFFVNIPQTSSHIGVGLLMFG